MLTVIEKKFLSVSACPHPFENRRADYVVPYGMTIAEIIEFIQPDPILRECGVVFLGEHPIDKKYWHVIKPNEKAQVSIRIQPTGGGGLRMIALAIVAVAAVALIVATAGAAAPFALGLSGATWGVIGATAIAIGGSLLVNTLLPPPVPEISKNYGRTSQAYAITGARNRPDYWGKLPFLLGKFKVTPPYAALPYREVLGGQIYWRALFAVGHGPIHIEEIRIGTTNIIHYQGIEYEYKRGYWYYNNMGPWAASSGFFPGDPQFGVPPRFGDQWTMITAGTISGQFYNVGETITYNGLGGPLDWQSYDRDQEKPFKLFGNDVFEDSQAAKVEAAVPVVRTSQPNADVLAIEIVFDRGLVHLQSVPAGKQSQIGVAIRIQQSPAGQNIWTTIAEVPVFGQQTEPMFWGWRWITSDYGAAQDANKRYDVRIFRLSADFDEQRNFGNFTWYSLRTETVGLPLPKPGVAVLSMRIKASGQLSGELNEVNCIAWTMARDWNAGTSEWIWRITQQPAALYRHILQHPRRERPAPDQQIDLETLQYWDDLTRTSNRVYNGIIDRKTDVNSTLIDLCRVGRAIPSRRDLIYSVIIDEPKGSPVRMFTPRNSWNYAGEMSHENGPDAYRVSFVNVQKDYAPDEIIVFDDFKNDLNAVRIDQVEWIGITNPDQAWKEGRLHLAQLRLRRELHKITTDFESLACERGDLIALQYDTISVGIGAARILSMTDNGTSITSVRIDQSFVIQSGFEYGIRVRSVQSNVMRTDLYRINTVAGEWDTFTLTTPVAIVTGPKIGDLIAFGQYNRETIRLLIKDIEPRKDMTAVLTLVSEAAGIHQAEIGLIPPWDPGITDPFPAPSIINVESDASVMLVTSSRVLITRVVFTVTPSPVANATYHVQFRVTGTDGQWTDATIQESSPSVIKIIGVDSGKTYDFRISRTHPDYLTSPATQVNGYTVIGRSAVPDPLVNLNIAVSGGQALLRWDLPADLDVQFGGWIMFRHSPLFVNVLWPNSTTIGRSISGDNTHVYLPLKAGTYLARVSDVDGRESTVVSVTTKQASVLTFIPEDEIQEEVTFTGSKVNCAVVSDTLRLSGGDFDSVANVDDLVDWDTGASGALTSGTYTFAQGMDFTTVKRVRLTSRLLMEVINISSTVDSEELVDSQEDWDGVSGAPVDAIVWARITDDDPAGTPTWSEYIRIDSTEVECRAVGQIQCRMETDDPSYNIAITELHLIAETI